MTELHEIAEELRAQERGKQPIVKGLFETENGQYLPFQLFYTKQGPGIKYAKGANNRVELMPDAKGDYHLRSEGSPFEIRQARKLLGEIATVYSQPFAVRNLVPMEREKAAAEFGYLATLLSPVMDESKH